MAYIERKFEALPAGGNPFVRHALFGLALQSIQNLVDSLCADRRGHDLGVLEDMQHVRRRGAEGAPGRGRLALRHDHLAHAELAREDAGVRGPRAAEGEQHEIARIEAFFHRHLADHVGHLQLDDAADPGGALRCIHSQGFCKPADGIYRCPFIQLNLPAREVVGVEVAEDQLGIGDGRHAAAAAVAHRPGESAGAVGADGHGARLGLDAHQAAAARADRLQVDFRQEVLVLVGVADERVGRLAVVDDRDVERGAAHVGGDDVFLAHRGAEEHRRGDARHRAGVEREQGGFAGAADRHRAAAALRDLQAVPVAEVFQAEIQLLEIARHHRAEVGVEGSGRDALVLAPLRRDVDRAGDENVFRDVLDQGPYSLLVRGIPERPEKADGDRLHPLGEQAADRRLGLCFVQRNDDFAEAIHPLGDAADQALRDDRRGLRGFGEMHHLADVAAAVAARAAHDVDRVLVPLGGDETDLRAALLDDGVGADRGAVRQERDVAAEPVQRNAERLRAGAEGVEHAAREVGRRRGNLGGQQLARAVDDGAVGERSADVDADEVAHYAILASEAAPLTTPGDAPSLVLPSCGTSTRRRR